MYVRMYICMYVCIYVCTYVYMYVRTVACVLYIVCVCSVHSKRSQLYCHQHNDGPLPNLFQGKLHSVSVIVRITSSVSAIATNTMFSNITSSLFITRFHSRRTLWSSPSYFSSDEQASQHRVDCPPTQQSGYPVHQSIPYIHGVFFSTKEYALYFKKCNVVFVS